MKMKSIDSLELIILIYVFILTYLFFHRSIICYCGIAYMGSGMQYHIIILIQAVDNKI